MKSSPEFSQTPAGQELLDAYKQDTVIAVNINGEWKEARVAETPKFDKNNALQLKVNVVGGQQETLAYETGEEPDIVVGEELTRDGIEDTNLGETYVVLDPVVSPTDGSIEYTLKAPDNKIYEHVVQELLLAWKKTLELEKKVAELEQQIDTVREDKKLELQADRMKMQLDLLEVQKHLPPEVANLQDADRTAVERIKKEVDRIHEEASKAIKEFEEKVERYEAVSKANTLGEERLQEYATPYNATVFLGEASYNFENESAIDKDRREKIEEAAHNEKKDKALHLKNEIQHEHEQLIVGKPKNIADQNKRDLFQDIFQKLEQAADGTYEKGLYNEIEKKRLELAKNSLRNVVTVAATPTQPEHKDFDDAGNNSSRFQTNINLLRTILEEQQSEYQIKDQEVVAGPGEEIFNWERSKEVLFERIQKLKEQLQATESDTIVGKEKQKQFQSLLELENEMKSDYLQCKDIDSCPDRLWPGEPKTLVNLNKLRFKMVAEDLERIKSIEDKLLEIDEDVRKKAEEKQIEDKRKAIETNPEKQKFKGEGIDIPSYELREMMLQRLGGVRSAMELMMRGGITRDKDGKIEVNPDLINQMKGIFGDTPPNGFDSSRLRKFGIKNWAKFKQLWDSELAERAMFDLNTTLTQTMERQIAENTGWRDQIGAHGKRMFGRALVNAGMLFGMSWGVGELVSSAAGTDKQLAKTLGDVGKGVGAAASGAVKWGTFKTFFGRKKAKDSMEAKTQALHETKKEEIIAKVLKSIFEGTPNSPILKTSNTDPLNAFASFSRLLSHTMREHTAGEETFTHGNQTFVLRGSELLKYKQCLNESEKKNVDEKIRAQLAWAVFKMTNYGNAQQVKQVEGGAQAEQSTPAGEATSAGDAGQEKKQKTPKELEIEALTKDAAVKNPKMVDNWVKNVSGLVDMSGKKALWKAVGTNFAISTLTMSVPYVGAGFSAILMGRLVGEFGDNLVTKWERGEAEERVDKQMKETIELTEKCRAEADPDKRKPLRKELEDRTLVLKRLLHATAPDEDMQAIVYKEKQKGEFPEDTTIGDKDYKKGDNLPDIVRIDGDRLGNIHDIVYEAERLSPYLEEEKNKNKLGKVIESLTKNGDAMEEKQKLDLPWTEKLSKKARRLFLKYGTAVAAAGITFATVGLIRGDFAHKPTDAEIQQTIENMKKVTGVSATEAGIAKAIADHKSTPAVDSTAGKGAGRTDIAPPPRDTPAPAPTPKHPDVAPKQVEKSPDIVKKSFGESNIKENEGPWSSMHRLIEEHRTDFNMSDKEWNALVKADLKRMGIEYGPNGESKWAIGVRVFRDGDTTEYAKVELYKGTDGQPHFRLIGEEGKTIVVHDHYRIKHAPGVVEKSAVADEKNTSTNANATPNKQTQLEKSSTQPAHTKTASGDTTSPNTLDKEQALGKASGKPAGETPLAKQQERFDNALKEKGDVKQFVGGVRKDGNVMVEFQDGTKQLYPAEMLGLSAGENGELVMHIPVDASAVVHTGVVSSSGVSSGGGGGSSSYSVGAKVPEGAKFFVTPDEAVEKTAANIAERAHDSGGGVRTDDSTSDSAPRGKDVYSAKTAPTEGKPVLDSGKVAPTDTIANGEKANIYAKGLHKAVDGIRADMAATNLEKTDIVSGLELKAGIEMLKQYDLAASGEVPAVLSNNLEDVAVIKEYVIEKLSPDVQLYLGIDGGSASLEGATAVDMSPSFVEGSNNSPVIRVTMPDGKQYILLPPKDMDAFSKGPDGQLVLRRGNKFFEAELDSTGDGGFPVIKAKVRS